MKKTILAGLLILFIGGALGCGTPAGGPPAPGSAAGNFSPNQPVSAPLIGYVWDQSASGLRPILGVSGAASLGNLLYADNSYTGAVVSVRRQYALLTNAKGQIALTSLPNGEPQYLMDRLSNNQQTTVSPSGNAALIYARDLSTVTLIQGLPAKPTLQTINLPPSLTVNLAAVNDSGLMLIATTQADGTTAIRSLTPASASASIVTVSQLGALDFIPRSTSALIADSGQNVVSLATGLGDTPRISRVAGAADGIAQPLAVAASADGHWAVIANRQGSAIVRVDLTNKVPATKLECGCLPAALIRLAGNGVFRLTELGTGSVPVFDGDAPSPRIVFIPGIPGAASQRIVQ